MPGNESTDVPSGAILTAVQLVEALISGEDEGSEAFADEVTALVRVWGIPVVTHAFGLLIGVAMSSVRPADGEPDQLHHVLPAILTRLRRMDLAEAHVATMGGALTAAALAEDPYRWRLGLGPVSNAEALAWCYTAWLMADFIDTIVLGEPGAFTRRLAGIVIGAEQDDET